MKQQQTLELMWEHYSLLINEVGITTKQAQKLDYSQKYHVYYENL